MATGKDQYRIRVASAKVVRRTLNGTSVWDCDLACGHSAIEVIGHRDHQPIKILCKACRAIGEWGRGKGK